MRILVVVLLAVMGTGTATRVSVWGDERALWAEAVHVSPDKPRPWINLGRQYALDGQTAIAAAAFTTAIDLALDRPTDRPMRAGDVARLNLALVRAQQGRYDEALRVVDGIEPRGPFIERLEATWRAQAAGWSVSSF